MKNGLKINRDFVSAWHPRYDETEIDESEYKALLALTASDIRQHQTLMEQTFRRIIDWKSPRVRGIIRFNKFYIYAEGVRAAYIAEEDKKIEVLVQLHGVGAPVASTILHFMFPNSFPIIDVRTAETLYYAGRIKYTSTDVSHYTSFRLEMLSILEEVSPFTLRELDRALFAYHKINFSNNQACKDRKSKPTRSEASKGQQGLTIKEKVRSVF